MKERTCSDCDADISERHGNARRCTECQAARTRIITGTGSRIQPCAVDDEECVDGRLKRGMCELHYRRLRQTGSTRLTVVDHLQRYEVTDGGCWLWTGPMFWNGYGHISEATFGTTLAHRAFYEAHRGHIEERDLDHLCRVRQCVNPDHLEAVTHAVNIQRGVEARSSGMCARGHDQTQPDARWTEPSTGRSYCRKCKAIREKEGHERRRAR
jgi:hypothetical protein